MAKALRLLHPGDVVTLERLDRVSRVVLHALKDDTTASRRVNYCLLHVKQRTKAHRLDLHFQQLLDRLVQRALHFTDTHRVSFGAHAPRYQHFRHEMRLA